MPQGKQWRPDPRLTRPTRREELELLNNPPKSEGEQMIADWHASPEGIRRAEEWASYGDTGSNKWREATEVEPFQEEPVNYNSDKRYHPDQGLNGWETRDFTGQPEVSMSHILASEIQQEPRSLGPIELPWWDRVMTNFKDGLNRVGFHLTDEYGLWGDLDTAGGTRYPSGSHSSSQIPFRNLVPGIKEFDERKRKLEGEK